jgi:hypothetical protein
MKKVIAHLCALAALLLSLQATAQPGGGAGRLDPVQRVESQTQLMTDSLSLSEAQAEKVREVLLKYAQKTKELFENSDGDREAMRASMQELRAQQDTELKPFLTDEQWTNWQRIRANMRGPGGRGRGEGQRPPGGGGERN